MRRRESIILIGGASAAWSFAALAQQPKLFRIGVLMGLAERDQESERWVQAFIEGLSELGWKRDTNLRMDIRWASADPARIQELAKELVDLGPDLILSTTTPPTAAILQLTHTIPVVFSVVSDPLGSGFVESFARPGHNATGFVNFEDSLASKWLELLKLLAPHISRVSLPFNPKTAPQSTYYLKLLEAAAPSFALSLKPVPVNTAGELEAEITSLAQQSNTGLVMLPDIFTGARTNREMIIARTTQYRIPAVYYIAAWAREGGLVSYGIDYSDMLRRSATYIDRILKGAKPQDLPVQLPSKFELAINLKTAKALGLTVPDKLIYTADEVIE